MGIVAGLCSREGRPESYTMADIFRLRGLRTLFSPPSKAEILGIVLPLRFPKWSIVFECLSRLLRCRAKLERNRKLHAVNLLLSVTVEHFGLRLPEN